MRGRLGASFVGDRLAPESRRALGDALRPGVEGRPLYTINGDYQTRHGGVLLSSFALRLYARDDRPEIIGHFGVQFAPARHNTGGLWFGNNGVIDAKLETSPAKTEQHHEDRFIERSSFA